MTPDQAGSTTWRKPSKEKHPAKPAGHSNDASSMSSTGGSCTTTIRPKNWLLDTQRRYAVTSARADQPQTSATPARADPSLSGQCPRARQLISKSDPPGAATPSSLLFRQPRQVRRWSLTRGRCSPYGGSLPVSGLRSGRVGSVPSGLGEAGVDSCVSMVDGLRAEICCVRFCSD